MDEELLERCSQWQPFLAVFVPRTSGDLDCVCKSLSVRLVLPWHRALRSVPFILQRLASAWSSTLTHDCGFDVRVNVTWSGGSKPLVHALRHKYF